MTRPTALGATRFGQTWREPGWYGIRLRRYWVLRDVERHPLRFSERGRHGCRRLLHFRSWVLEEAMTLETILYGPGDWLGSRFSARSRRAIAAWTLILIVATIPLRYPYRTYVSLVWAISELALILSMWGVVSAETPVEAEDA